jgi:xylulokinase
VAAGMATSGALTTWFRTLSGDLPFEQLLAEAGQAPAGSDGLVVLPYFAGERTPLFDPNARGVILGLTQRHGRGHIYRALLEATAFGVRHNLEAVRRSGGNPGRLVAVGGGTTGGLWAQIVSDVTGQDQDIPSPGLGASYGDAHFAATAAELTPLEATWATVAGTVRPNQATRPLYDHLYDIYRRLYPATMDLAHELAQIQLSASPVV